MGDPRQMYIKHPRVRMDGVYIAVCHYMYVQRLNNISPYQNSHSPFPDDKVPESPRGLM